MIASKNTGRPTNRVIRAIPKRAGDDRFFDV
jgi:hypothetical protein